MKPAVFKYTVPYYKVIWNNIKRLFRKTKLNKVMYDIKEM